MADELTFRRSQVTRAADKLAAIPKPSRLAKEALAILREPYAADPVPPPPPPVTPPPAGPTPSVAPPVGPFTVVDGGMQQDFGTRLAYGDLIGKSQQAIRKVHAKNHKQVNIHVAAWSNGPHDVPFPVLIEDCIGEDAVHVPAGETAPVTGAMIAKYRDTFPWGTAGANLWLGCQGNVKRFLGRRGSWMGMQTSNCTGSTLEELELRAQRVGIYHEAGTWDVTIKDALIEAWLLGITGEYNNICGRIHYDGFEIVMPEYDPRWEEWPGRSGYGVSWDYGVWGCSLKNGWITGGKGIETPRWFVNPAGGSMTTPTAPNTVENVKWRAKVGDPWITCPITVHERKL